MPRRLVETVNSLSAKEFFQQYLQNGSLADELRSLCNREGLRMILTGTDKANLLLNPETNDHVNQCLLLIEQTSGADYRNSELKWSRSKKKKEMLLPEMRYVILLDAGDTKDTPALTAMDVAGFVSFMITYEDGHEVIYCYEIHLQEQWQGKGIGKKLMAVVEDVGRSVGVEKAMLTVFKANAKAVKMYAGLGYVEDEFSPGPRKLRNGTVKEPSYIILSKGLSQ